MKTQTDRRPELNRWKAALVLVPFFALAIDALAATGGGGLSVSPALVEHTAVQGRVGAVRVGNNSGVPVNVSVTAHPWRQSANGAAVPDTRSGLHQVGLSASSFSLPPGGSKVVSVSISRTPRSGSLYGNVDVTGIPQKRSSGSGLVRLGYRLIVSLRLNPLHPKFSARAGGVLVSGNARHGAVALAVRNTGNTLDAIGGSFTLSGGRGTLRGPIAPVRIVPGNSVNVPILNLVGSLPSGGYQAVLTLTQAGHSLLTTKRSFTVR